MFCLQMLATWNSLELSAVWKVPGLKRRCTRCEAPRSFRAAPEGASPPITDHCSGHYTSRGKNSSTQPEPRGRAFSCALSASWRASSSILFFFCSRASTGNKAAESETMAHWFVHAASAIRLTLRVSWGDKGMPVTSPASARHFALRPLLPAWHQPWETGSLLQVLSLAARRGQRGGSQGLRLPTLAENDFKTTRFQRRQCHVEIPCLWPLGRSF